MVDSNSNLNSNDEISLVDVIHTMNQHRNVFFVVFVLILIPVFFFAATKKRTYEYKTVIEIGGYFLPKNIGGSSSRTPIESVGQTKSKTEEAFIAAAKKEMMSKPNGELKEEKILAPSVKVDAPKEANLIVLTSKGTMDNRDKHTTLHRLISKKMLEDHEDIVIDIIEQARQQKNSYAMQVKKYDAKITGLKKRKMEYEKKLELINEKAKLKTKQLNRVKEDIEALSSQKVEYLKSNIRSRDAMAVLLIDNEIKQSKENRDGLERQLKIDIEKEKLELNNSILSIERDISLNLKEAESIYDTYLRYNIPDDKQDDELLKLKEISPRQAKDGVAHTRIIRPTKVVVDCLISDVPVGLGKTKIGLIGILVALFFALFSCFVAELIIRVRGKSTS